MKNIRVPRSRGSYTVEASLVMAVVLTVLLLVMHMTWYLTDSVRMEAVLWESAVQAADRHTESAEALQTKGFYTMSRRNIRVSLSSRKAKAVGSGSGRNPEYGETYQGEISVTVRHPVRWIRIVRVLQDAA